MRSVPRNAQLVSTVPPRSTNSAPPPSGGDDVEPAGVERGDVDGALDVDRHAVRLVAGCEGVELVEAARGPEPPETAGERLHPQPVPLAVDGDAVGVGAGTGRAACGERGCQ